MGKKFNGSAFAALKMLEVSKQLVAYKKHQGRTVKIVSIYPYEDQASVLYTKLKKQDAESVGFSYVTKPVSLRSDWRFWLRTILAANQDPQVDAVLVQKPSQQSYQEFGNSKVGFATWWRNVSETINPAKDVDGLAPNTLFKLEKAAELVRSGQKMAQPSLDQFLLPATAQAVLDIAAKILGGPEKLQTKKVAVVGQSAIVGRPAAAGFEILGAKVDRLSSRSDLASQLKVADIVVSATGRSDLIQPSWIKPGAILLDVGAPKPEFSSGCYPQAAWYTPVPKGVGPVTRACLLENALKLS